MHPRGQCQIRRPQGRAACLSEKPDDPKRPSICFDKRPCQLLGEGREPLPMVPAYPARFRYEYTEHGACNLFTMVEPIQG